MRKILASSLFVLCLLNLGGCASGPQALSSVDPDEVNAALASHKSDFERCYERQPDGVPGKAGRVTAAFTILDDGYAKDVRVQESTLHAPGVESCVLGLIRQIWFPKPPSGNRVEIIYPFKFSPK